MLQAAEKKKVARSINDLGRRVTAADVSTQTGLPVLVVSQALNEIAYEAAGHMAVSQGGDIVYSFSPGFANIYLAEGLKRLAEKTFEVIFKVGLFLLKISFGVMLIFSFFIIAVTFFVLFFADRGNTRKDQKQAEDRFNFLSYLVFHDLFLYFKNPAPRVVYDYNTPTVRRRDKSNFLLDCFSFLFGDGDPNEGLDEKRWQLIAKVIKQNNNVITAEQLAPYTGADPKNEDAVLPVLVRFNGTPEVTESGNIVYRFPSLAVTSSTDVQYDEPAPPFLREFHWTFTELSPAALRPIYLIGGLNFAGSWFLWLLLHSSKAPSITALFTTLVTYGTLFLAVPLLRSFAVRILNIGIDRRNTRRSNLAKALANPDEGLKKKIAESREYRMRDKLIGQSNIVYTTEMDSCEQDEFASLYKPGDTFDAKPEETFDASPRE